MLGLLLLALLPLASCQFTHTLLDQASDLEIILSQAAASEGDRVAADAIASEARSLLSVVSDAEEISVMEDGTVDTELQRNAGEPSTEELQRKVTKLRAQNRRRAKMLHKSTSTKPPSTEEAEDTDKDAAPVDAPEAVPPMDVKGQWCVLLTATIAPFINVKGQAGGDGLNPQHDPAERRKIYEHSVEQWATKSNLPVIFVENSDADIKSIMSKVPNTRRADWEFVKVPPLGVNKEEIGGQEAHAILKSLEVSKKAQSCKKILKVTGRYFIHEAEAALRNCQDDAQVAVQNPKWESRILDKNYPSLKRQETQVFGFEREKAGEIFGWAEGGGQCMECWVTDLVRRWKGEKEHSTRICNLPPMTVDPVKEGSTGILRDSVSS